MLLEETVFVGEANATSEENQSSSERDITNRDANTLTASVGQVHWLYLNMDDRSPLSTAMQKWSQIIILGAAVLLVWRHLEPESAQ